MSKSKIKWKTDPESEDYDGVKEFLTLINSDADAERLLDRLRKAATIKRAAKDILRAAALPLLGAIKEARIGDKVEARKGL